MIKIGIIGLGRIGKVHIKSISTKIGSAKVVAAADPFLNDEMTAYAKEFGIENLSKDYKDVLNNPEVDAVMVCSSTDTHAAISVEAIKAGKHVFCEKPVDHSLEKIKLVEDALKENPVNKVGMFHCCPLNQELVKEALKLGFYISICGPITFKNSKNAEVIANMIPLDRILVETDSPYLSPEPLRGRRNDSRNIKYIVEKIANFKKVEPEVVMDSVFENIKRLFKNVKNI